MKSLIVLFLTTVAAIGMVAGYDDCSKTSLEHCLGDMLKVATTSQEGQLPSYTPGEFRNVCKAYDSSQTCLREIKRYCTSQERNQLDGIDVLFSYLCGEGFDVYVRNSECMLNKDLETSLGVCLQKYNTKSQELLVTYGSAQDKLSKLCRYTNDYVKCGHGETEKICGKEAAELIVESSRRVFDLVFKQASFRCPISTASRFVFNSFSLLVTLVTMWMNFL